MLVDIMPALSASADSLSLSASFHRADGSKEDQRTDGGKHDAPASKVESKGGFRACPQHSSEKLTLYSARARCFGCVKCFQEGVLRGHQGQSLQRAHEEVKEKLVRQHGTLLQQSRSAKEQEQVNIAADKLIEDEKCNVQAAVQRGVENIKADLQLKSAALAHAVEEWRQTKLGAADSAMTPLRADIESTENEIEKLKGWCVKDEEALLETFYTTQLDSVTDGQDRCKAVLATCQNRQVRV